MTDEEFQNTVNDYLDKIIIQYKNLSKAKGITEAFLQNILSKTFFEVQDAFNIDTAVGVQLDTLGKYIGVDRFFKTVIINNKDYVSYIDIANFNTSTAQTYIDIANFTNTNNPIYLSVDDFITTFSLNNDDYRILLKLKIIQNNSNHSMKTISDSLFVYFQNNIIINEIEGAFQIQYYINVDNINLNIINAMIDKKILPRPNSVRMSVVKQKIFFAFLSDTHLTYASNEAGFADETNEGGIFMSNEDVLL